MPGNYDAANPPHPSSGEIEFRLLCTSYAAGGLIGPAGTIIKRITKQTSTKIHVDMPSSPTNPDRLVRVIGSLSLDRTLHFNRQDFHVSAAQEGLFRAFERVLEAEDEEVCGAGGEISGGNVKCRMLVGPGLVGAVIGVGGKRAHKVFNDTGAYVKVFSSVSFALPPFADPTDQLLQITGDNLGVKNALVMISRFLQQKVLENARGAHGPTPVTPSRVYDQRIRMKTSNPQMNNKFMERASAEVSFKLLCPYNAAGWIIGSRGSGVRALEEETGASIRFSPLGTGCDERVVTVSAFENRKVQFSSAQNAVVRLYNKIVSAEGTDSMTAKLLIPPNESDWLSSGELSILSAIQKASGAALQIVELDYYPLPLGASADEKVLQINGDCHNVEVALFEVSWKLRERTLETVVAKSDTPFLPHKQFNVPSNCSEIATLTDDMSSCRVSEKDNATPPQVSSKNCSATSAGTSTSFPTVYGDPGLASGSRSVVVTNTRLELSVREDLFGAVYGDKGSNLDRLRLISGATVEVHDPRPGSEGKVILSGTCDQTMVAQSLLQAFLMSPQ